MVWKPIIISTAARMRDCTWPPPAPMQKNTRNRMPTARPSRNSTVPRTPKKCMGRYIAVERRMTDAERFIYRHILENRRDGLVSGLVRIGTDVTAILLLPAWIMVSRV